MSKRALSEFLDLLHAAMLDAATEGKMTQLQASCTPPGGRQKQIRIIIAPEEMDFVRSDPTGKLERPA